MLVLHWSLVVGSVSLLWSLVCALWEVSFRGETERRIGVVVVAGLLIEDIVDLVLRDVGGRLFMLADL